MSRTYNTEPKAKQKKKSKWTCNCAYCTYRNDRGRLYKTAKKLTTKEGIQSEGMQWCLDQPKRKPNRNLNKNDSK